MIGLRASISGWLVGPTIVGVVIVAGARLDGDVSTCAGPAGPEGPAYRSAQCGPQSVAPAPVAHASAAPASVAPAPVAHASVAPAPVAHASVAPASVAPASVGRGFSPGAWGPAGPDGRAYRSARGTANDLGREERFIFPPERGHVHASSLVETSRGDLLAVWYENGPTLPGFRYPGPDRDKSDDVRIAGAWWRKGETGWGAAFVMADTFGVSDNNPALAIDRRERLWLIYPTLVGVPGRPWTSAIVQFRRSSSYQAPGPPVWDTAGILPVYADGLSAVVTRHIDRLASDPNEGPRAAEIARALRERLADPLSHRLGWMPRTHPLALEDGGLLVPLANENFNVAAMVRMSADAASWTVSQPVPTVGVLQPALVRVGPSRLVAFFRDGTSAKRVRRSESQDDGLTWTPAEPTSLPNPGSGVDAALLDTGALVLAHNDQTASPRDRLSLSMSTDEGRTWPWTRRIEHVEGQRFDYPSVVAARDGSIHVTYSWNLKQVKHVRVTAAWIRGEPTK